MPVLAPNGASRAGLWLSMALSVTVLLGMAGTVFYVGFKVQATADALDVEIRRQAATEERLSALTDRMTRQEVALNEIETQFCAEDTVRNLMHAGDMRNFALVWEKTFGTIYPTANAYYPNICNRHSRQR